MKIVVNAYMSILIEGVAEALELATELGVDAAKLAEAIEGGPLDAPIADAKLHKMERGDYAPEFPLQWALKDVDLALAERRAPRCRCLPPCPAVARHRRRRTRPRRRERRQARPGERQPRRRVIARGQGRCRRPARRAPW